MIDNNDEIQVWISSPPDRDLLVAEIMVNNEQFAELSQEGGKFTIEIYARRDGLPWTFSYQAVLESLIKAKSRLTGTL